MCEFDQPPTIDSILTKVGMACDGVDTAEQRAQQYDRLAHAAREGSRITRAKSFSRAAWTLGQLSETNEYPLTDIVKALVELMQLDPSQPLLNKMTSDPIINMFKSDERLQDEARRQIADSALGIVQSFEQMKTGAPVYQLPSTQGGAIFGILSSEPYDLKITDQTQSSPVFAHTDDMPPCMSPSASARCDLVDTQRPLEIDICKLHHGVAGKAAIQAFANDIRFKQSNSGAYLYGNQGELATLRDFISAIRSNTVVIDTTSLDNQIEAGKEHGQIVSVGRQFYVRPGRGLDRSKYGNI